MRYEPDILAPGLEVVFCGVNPAATAAVDGHNFSNRSNRFWSVLHLAGFTDTRLRPEEERRLLDYGCGITAVVIRPTRRADDPTLRAASGRLSRKAGPGGDERPTENRLGTLCRRVCGHRRMGAAQSERPQQRIHARRPGARLRRITLCSQRIRFYNRHHGLNRSGPDGSMR
jgi:hypothetical protein